MVSVIIPLYNKKALVKKAIDSVLSQTFHEFEIIVVDDGSKDDSAKYVKAYADFRINYYYKDNGGVSSARNYGIEKAQGEWLLFLDADDELYEDALFHFSQQIERFPKCKVFVGQQEDKVNISGLKCIKTTYPYFHMWLNRFYPRPGAVLVHKDVIEKIKGFDLRQSFYEDLDFGLRVLQNNTVVYFNQQVVKYNQDGSGLSASSHPIENEMAYYIPGIVSNSSFWHKALLFENLEAEIFWWQLHGDDKNVRFYRDMQRQNFSNVHKVLHWVRQKMIRKGII